VQGFYLRVSKNKKTAKLLLCLAANLKTYCTENLFHLHLNKTNRRQFARTPPAKIFIKF